MVKELQQICKQLYTERGYHYDDVDGECAKASFALHLRLKEIGINSKLYVVNDMHCFVTTLIGEIEYVLDLTYTQFNSRIQDIIVEPLSEYRQRKANYDIWFSVPGQRNKIRWTDSARHFRRYLLRNWPTDQKPLLQN